MTTLRGSTSEFPLESVIGLLAGTSKTGELQVRAQEKVGALGFANGRLVAAVMDDESGENALGAIFAIGEANFEFTPWQSPPDANLEGGDLVALLKRAAEARDRLGAIREQIPNDRVRFKLSEKAADHGAVTFTPDRWRALLAVNGARDVNAIAEQLRLGRMDTLVLLAGLAKDGVIETTSPPEMAREPQPTPPPAPEPMQETAPEWKPEEPQPWAAPEPESTPGTPTETVTQEPATFAAPERMPEPSAPSEREPPSAPPSEARGDLDAQMAERFSTFAPSPEDVAPPSAPHDASVPPAIDDRLSSLTGIFAAGPAANAPPKPAPSATPSAGPQAQDAWTAAPPRAAESWMTPPPASSEAPANAWAPLAPAQPEAPAAPRPAPPPAAKDVWSTPAPPAEAPVEKKKSGLFGMFRRDEPTPISQAQAGAATAATRPGMLASFSNALLVEYNSGAYGKGKIETRMANLLMRVDEQADPIDRPLPIVDDLIDATALERESFPEEQAVPYLATLVRQIYEDAERAFGKDKAKKGYKTAQQQVFRTDASLLQSPELAGKLPKV